MPFYGGCPSFAPSFVRTTFTQRHEILFYEMLKTCKLSQGKNLKSLSHSSWNSAGMWRTDGRMDGQKYLIRTIATCMLALVHKKTAKTPKCNYLTNSSKILKNDDDAVLCKLCSQILGQIRWDPFTGVICIYITHQIAGNVKAFVVCIAAAQSFVSLLAHMFLQRCTIFKHFLTVKTFQTAQHKKHSQSRPNFILIGN